MIFIDQALAAGLGTDSLNDLTWGVRFADFDLDGRLDLLTVNGHVEQNDAHMLRPGRYRQSPRLYWNSGTETPCELVPLYDEETGAHFGRPISGRLISARSMAVADFDADGDFDVVLAGSGQQATVYRNDVDLANRDWLQVKIVGRKPNSEGIGARLQLTTRTADGKQVTQTRFVSRTHGYLSSSSPVQALEPIREPP